MEGITPEHFKHLFKNFAKEATLINKECVVSEFINMEEGRFETLVQIFRFPLITERIIVNTQYLSTEYEGKKDYHLCIFSSQENEKYMTKEKLGDLVDGNRVFLDNILSGYII